jgi:methionyl-tRNA formyltransferase
MRVLLAAEEGAGVFALRAVLRSDHDLVAVMTSASGPHGSKSPVRAAAAQLGCRVWPAEWVKDPGLAARIRTEKVDVLLNVHSLFVIRPDVLVALRHGAYNMHPGPLPEYAGLNSVSWAVYQGEPKHAVTIHRIVPRVDAGPIAYTASFPLGEEDTALTVGVKCIESGLVLLDRLLAGLATDPPTVPELPQDLTRRRYYGRAVPNGGWLEWSRPARELVNFVRACDYMPFESPWGHPRALFGGRELLILKAGLTRERCADAPGTVGRLVDRGALVAAADEWVFVHSLMSAGRVMDAREALAPGARFDEPAPATSGRAGTRI